MEVTLKNLIITHSNPFVRYFKRKVLSARIRALYRHADYFKQQVDNGNHGLSITHKDIAVAESDLRRLG